MTESTSCLGFFDQTNNSHPREGARAGLDLHSIAPRDFHAQFLIALLVSPVIFEHTRIVCGSHRIAASFVGETICLRSIAVLSRYRQLTRQQRGRNSRGRGNRSSVTKVAN